MSLFPPQVMSTYKKNTAVKYKHIYNHNTAYVMRETTHPPCRLQRRLIDQIIVLLGPHFVYGINKVGYGFVDIHPLWYE